ncbi:MAG: LTA synthase family protein, partial [Pedobacter sp.]
MLKKSLRLNEYAVLFYRLFLAYLFYQISRILFYAFNTSILHLDGLSDLLKLCWHGFAFDTTALLYINSLFILLSVLPLTINTR